MKHPRRNTSQFVKAHVPIQEPKKRYDLTVKHRTKFDFYDTKNICGYGGKTNSYDNSETMAIPPAEVGQVGHTAVIAWLKLFYHNIVVNFRSETHLHNPSHTHSHTHAYALTYTSTYTCTFTCTCTHANAGAHADAYAHAHARAHAHAHAHAHA